MKTIRELINLIETAQTPVDRTVRVLPDVGEIGIDSDASPGNGSWYVKLYDGSYDVVGFNSEAEAWRELSSLQDLDTGNNDEQGVAESTDEDVEHLANVAADAYWSGKFGMTSATEKVKMARDIVQAVEDGRLSIEELRQDIKDLDKPGVAEALSKTDLLKQVSAELNNPEFRKKPVDPTKSFTRGDHWQGAKPGDYGYTGYQGHGMPTDRAERARIRADKKKQQDK